MGDPFVFSPQRIVDLIEAPSVSPGISVFPDFFPPKFPTSGRGEVSFGKTPDEKRADSNRNLGAARLAAAAASWRGQIPPLPSAGVIYGARQRRDGRWRRRPDGPKRQENAVRSSISCFSVSRRRARPRHPGPGGKSAGRRLASGGASLCLLGGGDSSSLLNTGGNLWLRFTAFISSPGKHAGAPPSHCPSL